MAEHRRVEARIFIAGTGMASDVDRLRDIEADKQRKERMWREAPDRGFGEVLTEAPARGELEEEERLDPRRKKRPPELPEAVRRAPSPAAMASAAADMGALAAEDAQDLPRVAPDPRERMLREQLASNVRHARGPAPVDTPPTGKHLRKP